MSNYTTANLIPVLNPANGIPAIRIGYQVFTMVTSGGGGGSMDFYKCASVSGPYTETYYAVSGAGIAAVNGNYTDTGTTSGGKPVYSYTNSGTTYYLFYDSGWESWFIHTSTSFTGEDAPTNECLYYLSDYEPDSWYVGGGGSGDPPTVTLTSVTHDIPKTWTGYKAVQDPVTHVYSFESTATTGLTYSVVTPEVGNVYADGALIKANLFTIPTDSLVLYASLNGITPAVAETGQTIGTIGSVNYGTVSGIPCADSDTTKTLYVDELMAQLDPGIPKTLSVWIRVTSWSSNNDGVGIICCVEDGGGCSIVFDATSGHADRWKGGGEGSTNYDNVSFGQLSLDTWYHLAFTDDGNTMKTYVNGTLVTTATPGGSYRKAQNSINAGITGPGDSVSDFGYNLIGHMAAYRIYNRALTTAEIAALASEFTPTQS